MVEGTARPVRAISVQVIAMGDNRYAVRGPLTFATARRACQAGLRAFAAAADHAPLELDCSGITGADSAGLAVLIAWAAWARRQGRRMRCIHIPEALAALASISDVQRLLVPAAGNGAAGAA